MTHPSADLAEFAAQLVYEDIPENVLRRTEDLMLDCLASALAGSSVVLVCGLPRSGWVVPEAVQALPPLLPSGLFRPPCA